jgi:N-carbamoylputrescine amidase
MKRNIRIASIQIEHTDGDKSANFAKVEEFIRQAADKKIDIAVFPECCLTGYWFLRNLDRTALVELSESVPGGPLSEKLRKLSVRTGITIGAGLVEMSEDGRLYNTYLVSMPDGNQVKHRKIHTFVNSEMDSGDEYTVFDDPHGCRLGVLICYDNNIGENVRMTALRGAEILLAPHQTGGCTSTNPNTMGLVEREVWDNRVKNPAAIEAEFKGNRGRGWLLRWLPARAHDNGIFLAFSNGVGVDDDEVRTGNSMIIDPYGRILAETWKAEEIMVTAELNRELLVNTTGNRWIRTRRPELYGDLAKPTGLEEDVKKVRFDKEGV